jgi:hypothetical protein
MAEMKNEQKETMACQEVIQANPEKMKPHPGGKEPNSVELESIPMHQELGG